MRLGAEADMTPQGGDAEPLAANFKAVRADQTAR
jgi:hypothetical protein